MDAAEIPRKDETLHQRSFGATALGLIGARPVLASTQLPGGVFGSLRQIETGLLDVGHVKLDPRDGPAALLLHGWPYDIHSFR